MIFNKHINRYYLKYAPFLLLGILVLLAEDYLLLLVPQMYPRVINGINTGLVTVNGVTLGTWVSPGDYGGRRGRLNPSWWSDTSSQFGLLKTWRVDADGSKLDGEPLSGVRLADLKLDQQDYISLRVGVRADSEHVGGLNLFGDKFGDFAQGVVMRVGYAK